MTTIHSTIQLTPATPTRTHRLLFPALRCSAKQTKHQAPGKKFDKGSPPSPTSNKKILSPKLTTTTAPPPLPLPPVHLSLRTYTSSVRSLSRSVNQFLVTFSETGTSANAGPHYQKLYARVTHIWGNRGGQSNRSAMRGPRPGRTALVITVPPASGKFFIFYCLRVAGGAMVQRKTERIGVHLARQLSPGDRTQPVRKRVEILSDRLMRQSRRS